MREANRTHTYHLAGLTVRVRPNSVPDGIVRTSFRYHVQAPDGRASEGELAAFYPFQAANVAARMFIEEGRL